MLQQNQQNGFSPSLLTMSDHINSLPSGTSGWHSGWRRRGARELLLKVALAKESTVFTQTLFF